MRCSLDLADPFDIKNKSDVSGASPARGGASGMGAVSAADSGSATVQAYVRPPGVRTLSETRMASLTTTAGRSVERNLH